MSRSNNQTAASEKSWPRMGLISRENGGCALTDISCLHLRVSITGLIAALGQLLREYWLRFRAQVRFVMEIRPIIKSSFVSHRRYLFHPPNQLYDFQEQESTASVKQVGKWYVDKYAEGGRRRFPPRRQEGGSVRRRWQGNWPPPENAPKLTQAQKVKTTQQRSFRSRPIVQPS